MNNVWVCWRRKGYSKTMYLQVPISHRQKQYWERADQRLYQQSPIDLTDGKTRGKKAQPWGFLWNCGCVLMDAHLVEPECHFQNEISAISDAEKKVFFKKKIIYIIERDRSIEQPSALRKAKKEELLIESSNLRIYFLLYGYYKS